MKSSFKLNKEQKRAVSHDKGPVLIIAGAGTGKTAVLTNRIAYLIKSKKAKPEEILALTFTEKAAGQMQDRADKLLLEGYSDLWISTFHSFAERILRERGLDIGLNTDFKILNDTKAWLFLRKDLSKFDFDYYKSISNPSKFIKALISHFSRCKDQNISPKDYLEYANGAGEDKERLLEIAKAYEKYQKLLLENSYMDFGDLINYCLLLFKKRPLILEKYRKQFKYVLVDEFQDTNWAQYELLKMLVFPENNLMAVADDDQSIYKFRGASFSNIRQFNKDFPKAENIVLTRNYRSFQDILDLAYRFIQKNNPERLEYVSKISKRLKAENKGKAEILNLSFETLEQEAQGTAFKIIELLKKDKKALLSDFAVLIRANSYGQPFFRAFERANIPFQFLARKGLYSRPVIMDIISYLKLLDNYHENSALYRILSLPFLKIGFEDIAKITYFSNKKAISIYEALSLIEGIPNKNKIMSLIKKHSELSLKRNVSEVIFAFLEDSGYLEYLAKKGSKEDFSHINSFFEKAKMFESENMEAKTKDFVKELDLELESGEEGNLEFEDENSVKIMTVHAAKGLEFKYVFIVNLVDKRFPTIEKKEQIEIPELLIKDIIPEKDFHLQEERRLFYVALTRAKQGLFLMSAKNYGGEREKKKSLFLKELGFSNANIIVKPKLLYPNCQLRQGEKSRAISAPGRHFSFTQLAAFKTCPLQYKFNHILKIPVKGKASLVFGKTIHNTLAELVLKLQEKKLSLNEVIKIYKDNWIEDWYESKKQKEEYYELGKETIKRFYDDFTKEKPEICLINGKPAIEQNFKLKIKEDVLIGKIDRIDNIDGGAEIIDYKTGKGKEKIDSSEKTQLLLYQIAAKEVLGINPEKLTYYYIENGKKISFLGTEKEIEKEKEKITSLIEKMKGSDFKATPGWHCSFCDYNSICEFSQK